MRESEHPSESAVFTPKCLSIDLEVGKKDSRIHQFAAIRGDTDNAFVYNKGDLNKALEKLDVFAESDRLQTAVSCFSPKGCGGERYG